MSEIVLLKTERPEEFQYMTSTVYHRSHKGDRMRGVIVEKYKRRCCKSCANTIDLLAKEELCCDMATD